MRRPRNSEDQDLIDRFQALRAQEARRTPSFGRIMERARAETASGSIGARPRIVRRLVWGGSLLAAAAAAVILLVQPPSSSEAEFVQVVQQYSQDPAAGAWRSPTDDLLKVPGRDLLSSVPTIKTSRWMVAPLPAFRRNPS